MYIEEELLAYLDETISHSSANRERDKKVIAFYYGFGSAAWPTLEQAGDEFGISTRERVRQIINSKFRDAASISDLPSIETAAEIISETQFSPAENLVESLVKAHLCGPEINLKGLLNLLQDFNLCADYEICTWDLQRLTREELEGGKEFFLVNTEFSDALKGALKQAKTLPGMLGLAKIETLEEEVGDEMLFDAVLQAIVRSEDFCLVEQEDTQWYCWEESDNVLLNYCGKIFNVTETCDTHVLAQVLCNALKLRVVSHEYPPEEVVEAFIKQSRSFFIDGDKVSFDGKKVSLTDIQEEVVAYLSAHDVVDFNPLLDHLIGKGFSRPASLKAITASPLVLVDRSAGRKKYKYSLIGGAGQTSSAKGWQTKRYEQFMSRLQKLLGKGTDFSVESTQRREQGILQEWLFGDKDVETCALCGKTYTISALVVAHKKKRSICTEAERVDPNIVMPLCLFGCDFLYERQYVRVHNGVVCTGRLPDKETFDKQTAVQLLGRQLEERWLSGSDTYFSIV